MNYVSGIDMSISSPAICNYAGPDNFYIHFRNELKTRLEIPDKRFICNQGEQKHFGVTRYYQLALWSVMAVGSFDGGFTRTKPKLVVFEGASYGSIGRIGDLCMNVGASKVHILDKCKVNPSHILDVDPKTVKKFATGTGKAEKDQMVMAFIQDTNIDLSAFFPGYALDKKPLSDIADSYWIAKYAYNHLQ